MCKAECLLDDIQHYYYHLMVLEWGLSIGAQTSMPTTKVRPTPGTKHDTTKFWNKKKYQGSIVYFKVSSIYLTYIEVQISVEARLLYWW